MAMLFSRTKNILLLLYAYACEVHWIVEAMSNVVFRAHFLGAHFCVSRRRRNRTKLSGKIGVMWPQHRFNSPLCFAGKFSFSAGFSGQINSSVGFGGSVGVAGPRGQFNSLLNVAGN
uniref:Putative secreted protein n=1 Tax=Ixodes ricinus TaxID=34613 RepID=A0A6B0UM49_IXORI